MNNSNAQASKGLKYLFIGQIVALLAFFPFIGGVIGIAGIVISMLGFYTLSKVSPKFQTAFILQVVCLVVSVLYVVGILTSILDIVTTLLNLFIVYYVCHGTAELLKVTDKQQLVSRASTIWTMYLICTVIHMVCTLIMYIPIINILALLIAVVTAIVQLVASIMYMVFLWNSHKALNTLV